MVPSVSCQSYSDWSCLHRPEPTSARTRRLSTPTELLWTARILAGLVRVHRNVIPDMREKVKVAQAILESYADVPDFDPREPNRQ